MRTKSLKIPKKYDVRRKDFKKKVSEKLNKDFLASLQEENPDLNLKKYL